MRQRLALLLIGLGAVLTDAGRALLGAPSAAERSNAELDASA